MVINILEVDRIRKINLPNKIYGSYAISDSNGNMLANIEAENNKWMLKHNDDIEITCEGQVTQDVVLQDYFNYTIKNKENNSVMELMPTPKYDNYYRYTINKTSLKISNDASADICYSNGAFNGKSITLTKDGNHWICESNGLKAYVLDKVFRKRNLFQGDYIFFDGLKVIVINNLLLVNNPNNRVAISNNNSLTPYKFIPQKMVYQTGITNDQKRFNKDEFFYKSPRFRSIREPKEISITPPPNMQENTQVTPTILTIGPALTTSSMSAFSLFQSLQSYALGETTFSRVVPTLLSAGVMLASSFLWPSLTRAYQKRIVKKNVIINRKAYLKYLDDKQQEINERKSLEQQIIVENSLPLEECQSIIYNRKRNLWERNIEDDDFLSVNIGIGSEKSMIEVPDSSTKGFSIGDESYLEKEYNKVLDSAKYIDNVPLGLSLVDHKITAVVGNNILTKYFLDGIFLKIMTFHSYRDLKIIVLTNEDNSYLWEYLKVIPHCWDNLKQNRYFATNQKDINIVTSNIENIFNERLASQSKKDEGSEQKKEDDGAKAEGEAPYKSFRTYYLIFIDDYEKVRDNPTISKILRYKTNLGFSIIIRNNKLSNLPSECKTFIDVESDKSGLFESDITEDNQKVFKADFNRNIDMYGCALRLANIPMRAEKAKYELPSSISFLTMYNVGKVEQLNSLERWHKNNPVASLAVPVGVCQDGELFNMDAHEKGWGPHGLVAGTTGSGKSEWLITYILSLAVNFHPDEVQFVIIDYKGGGLALSFENKQMGIRLPHLAGTITNLDKSTINRALVSITAELQRRQRMFNAAREKLHLSSMDIYKYQEHYRKGELDEPISHLFIISDEFAELKSQEPEFLNQLVSTARIGRSLGVHLILATQKPSGVVNDQIWSNSRFHVCLRVQDKSDSMEMIKTPDAAMLKTTGAFYLQVGYNEYYALGQSAYSGAKYHPSNIIKKKIDDSVQKIDNLGNVKDTYELQTEEKTDNTDHGEELLNIVKYLNDISKQEHVHGKQLWLPNISETIYLDDVKKKYGWKPTPYVLNTCIGEYDNPALQLQNLLSIDIGKNTAVFGETGSGKENLLTTMIWSCITEHSPDEVNFYLIDYGAETLRVFSKYPQVGEVAFQNNPDQVISTIQLVLDEIDRRRGLFADYDGTYESYIKNSGKKLPRIVVVINAWDMFIDSVRRVPDVLDIVFRDSVKMGVSFILSTTVNSAINGRRLQNIDNIVMMHLADDYGYRNISNCPKELIPHNNFGRGITSIDANNETYCEFQTAFVTKRDDINKLIKLNADNFNKFYKTRAKSLPKIPENVTSEKLTKFITDINNIPVGYNFHEKDVAKFDFLREKLMLISVNDIKQNIQSIYGFINIISKTPGTAVRVVDLSKLYQGSNVDIKLFTDKYEAVMLALDEDMKKRKSTQNKTFNIILGAGLLKTRLTDQGKKILTDYMKDVNNYNLGTTILIDNYQRLRTLKIEPWYAQINTSYGIWIGTGIDTQNIYNVKDITMEERKLHYDGLAFLIVDSEYHIIKTVLDEE